MDTTLMSILIVVLLAWVFYFRPINPSSKTDDQLWTLYRIALRGGPRDLKAIETEMRKRGLLGSGNATKNIPPLSPNQQKQLDEMTGAFEKSGMRADIARLSAAGVPENIFDKTLEIAMIRCISPEEASNYFQELFEAALLEYRIVGLSEDEADVRALEKVLTTEILPAEQLHGML